jgi:hypothetical protein
MKKRKNIWTFALIAISFVGGWLFAMMYSRHAGGSKYRGDHQELLMSSLRQIDSLNHLVELDRELIVRISGKLDSMQNAQQAAADAAKQTSGRSSLYAANRGTKKSDAKVFMASDSELEFFNTYIENETDINF